MERHRTAGPPSGMVACVCTIVWLVGCLPPRAGERIACHVTDRENSDVAYPATHVYVMDGDGRNRTLVADGCRAAWSPDGRKLLVVDRTFESLQVVEVESGASTPLADFGDSIDGPTWSPNGAEIAFRVHYATIWIVSTDGSGAHPLTDLGGSVRAGRPSWSPTGANIVFPVSRDGDRSDVYLMNRDGSDVVRLTEGAGDYDAPMWSPTDDSIAFEQTEDGESWVCVMNSDGSGRRCLARGQLYGWSPDGGRLYFHFPFEDTLWTMNSDGSSRRRLFQLNCEDPAWSVAAEAAD
jgi:TolB protein